MYKQAKDILKIYENPAVKVGVTANPAGRMLNGSANALLYAATAVAQAFVDIMEDEYRAPGTIEANAVDFLKNVVQGDSAAADLDAATLAAQLTSPSGSEGSEAWRDVLSRTYGTSDAVTAWFALEVIAESAY